MVLDVVRVPCLGSLGPRILHHHDPSRDVGERSRVVVEVGGPFRRNLGCGEHEKSGPILYVHKRLPSLRPSTVSCRSRSEFP